MDLTDGRLLVFKFHFDETVTALQFENAKLHFDSLYEMSLAPGEIQELHVFSVLVCLFSSLSYCAQ